MCGTGTKARVTAQGAPARSNPGAMRLEPDAHFGKGRRSLITVCQNRKLWLASSSAKRWGQAMEIQALGYLGVGTARLDDWTSLATRALGMQPVDHGAGIRAFRMDDRRQRLFPARQPAPPQHRPRRGAGESHAPPDGRTLFVRRCRTGL